MTITETEDAIVVRGQAWSHAKRERVELAFYKFLNRCYVDSKDLGHVCLGDHLYWGQYHVITEIFDALEEGIHDVYILKARQLGISTIVRALTIFMLGLHKGLKGALVFDTAPNREEARIELEAMIHDLPGSLKFPPISGSNREGLTLANKSRILFKSAGTKKSKSSGTLGRSVGLCFATLSELCSYDNDEGLVSFEESLSDINPDRLYIRESTARGFNSWNTIWEEARRDPQHKRCIFLGWWSKESQKIDRNESDFERYGAQPPTDKELKKIQAVREKYNFEVSAEQLAWYRRKMDPSAEREGDDDVEYEGSTTRIQEQPWTEEEAFQNTGSQFFPSEKLTEQMHSHVSRDFKGYLFTPGAEFRHMMVHRARNIKETDLKIWEEPDPNGVYCFAVDPAFGENENNDRSSIQIGRCYSDGIDQVGEYASPFPTPQQLAWILASLMGWYGSSDKSECRYILELNGPGSAVFNEIRNLRQQLDAGYHRAELEEKGLRRIFQNVKTFIYTRPDGMSAGQNYHFKTNLQLKIMIMNHLRDYANTQLFRIRSADLITEMQTVTQEGDTIKAPGSKKDDRVVAAAFLVYYWQNSIRKQLITQNRTREAEIAKSRLSITDQVGLFNRNMLQSMFDAKRRERLQVRNQAIQMAWRRR